MFSLPVERVLEKVVSFTVSPLEVSALAWAVVGMVLVDTKIRGTGLLAIHSRNVNNLGRQVMKIIQ